jgi:hypothetical protein
MGQCFKEAILDITPKILILYIMYRIFVPGAGFGCSFKEATLIRTLVEMVMTKTILIKQLYPKL